MRTTYLLWPVLVIFALATAGLSMVFLLPAPLEDQPWPLYLTECRYAEINNRAVRNTLNIVASVFGANDFCSNIYYSRGDNFEPRWKDAAKEYEFGLRISPNNLALRNSHAASAVGAGQLADAEADYTKILQATPNDPDVLTSRGEAREGLGDWQGAIADFSSAIRINPEIYGAYTYRGRALALLGRYPESIADLTRAAQLLPDDLSTNLWLYLARRKAGREDTERLRNQTKNIDLNRWPGPAIKYFLGQISEDMLQRVANNDPSVSYFRQRCDAWFYLAEEALINDEKLKARSLLKRTVSRCDVVDYE